MKINNDLDKILIKWGGRGGCKEKEKYILVEYYVCL